LIADAANGLNEGTVVAKIHLAPKIVDIDIYDVRHDVQIKLPDLLENRGVGNGLPGVGMRSSSSAYSLGLRAIS
jgi:hypothetical protein